MKKIQIIFIMLLPVLAMAQFTGGNGRGDFMLGYSPCANPANGGEIGEDQTICYGTAPSPFTSVSFPSGHTGDLEYQWQLNTVSSTASFVDWVNVGTNTNTYEHLGTLTQTTWFRRLARVTCETDWVESNVVEVTVEEELTLICPESFVVNNDEGVCGASSVSFAAIAGGTPTPTLSYKLNGEPITSPHDFSVGTHTVEATATNYCGSVSCTFEITVSDREKPEVVTQNITAYLDEDGKASITPEQIDDGSTDNCGTITKTLDITEFDCDNLGDNTVTLTVKDNASYNTGSTFSGLIGHWTFEPGKENTDLTGNWGTMNLFGNATVANGYLQVNEASDFVRIDDYTGTEIVSKTLLSWVSLTDLSIMTGSALTIDGVNTDHFDGLVYGELQPNKWMAGSDFFTRTQDFVPGYAESIADELLMIAITYQDLGGGQVQITGYRNGEVIGSYTSGNIGSWSAGNAEIWMGKRHGGGTGGPGELSAKIYESQLYGRALSAEEIQTLYSGGIYGPNQSSKTAIVTVEDDIDPVAIAKNITVTLDPNGVASITGESIDHESYDNCSFELSASKTSFNCSNLGSNPVTLTATDGSGHSATANSVVTVVEGTALLPPWAETHTINPAWGDATYSPCTNNGTFYLTSTGQSTTTNDVYQFVYQPLTGNGTIIARLSDVKNDGWAGVMMRESNAPNAKTILFKTRLYNPNVLIGYRNATGKTMTNMSQVYQLIRWMKIQRNGNTFQVFVSYNGTTWTRCYTATIAMTNIINAGIFTESYSASRTSRAWFDHVELSNLLKSGEEFAEAEILNPENEQFDVQIYPNPATDEVNITLTGFETLSGFTGTLLNTEGKMMKSFTISETQTTLNVQDLQPGVYILRFENAENVVIKRLVIQ